MSDGGAGQTTGPEQVGYRELIASNRRFRLLWFGTIVSLFGDWFNTIAVYTLIEQLTNSPFAMGMVFVIKTLGFALAAPLGGMVVDRLDRRKVMIVCDLLRALVVAGFLFVDDPSEVPLLFVLLGLQVVLSAPFEPAFRALIPNVCGPRELLTANTIFAATWSTLLAVGAAAGGFAVAGLGLTAVFVIDVLSYLLSAFFIARVDGIEPPPRSAAREPFVGELVGGATYLRAHPAIARMALAKAVWGMGGGALVYMLTQLGELITPGDIALGIGVLFSARGLGTGLGPVLARWLLKDQRRWPRFIGACVVMSGICYMGVGLVGVSFAVTALVIVAHMGSGANWVLSTVLLQEVVPDAVRGRVFSAELFALMTIEAVTVFAVSALLEAETLSLTSAFLIFGGLQAGCAALWTWSIWRDRWPREAEPVDTA